MLPHSTNFGLFHSLLKQLWPSQEFCPYHRSSVSKDGRMRNSLHVTCVKVYIYISLFWRCYCKCGVFGRQFFFFPFFFFFPKKHLLLSITYFDITLGVGQAQPTTNVKEKMHNTYCIVRLTHLHSPSRRRSVQTHEYILFDLHNQTDWLDKLLDDQKNYMNHDQSLTLNMYLYTITLTVKVTSHLALAL